jgi:hypothetical protein
MVVEVVVEVYAVLLVAVAMSVMTCANVRV